MRRIILMAILTATSAAQTAQLTPEEVVRTVGFDQRLNATVPLDLRFRGDSGQVIPLRDCFHTNKPVVLVLGYYQCPMLCTAVLNGLSGCLRLVELNAGSDFDVVMVSVDPNETPELAARKKSEYLKQYNRPGAADGWHFLTGDKAAIETLAQSVGFRYVYDFRSKQYVHPSGIVVLTPQGRISKYFLGVDYAASDLRLALVEASQGAIGTASDKLLLLCYSYDPVTGKYGLAIMTALRVAGAATVLALLAYIVIMVRRERRRTPPTLPGDVAQVRP